MLGVGRGWVTFKGGLFSLFSASLVLSWSWLSRLFVRLCHPRLSFAASQSCGQRNLNVETLSWHSVVDKGNCFFLLVNVRSSWLGSLLELLSCWWGLAYINSTYFWQCLERRAKECVDDKLSICAKSWYSTKWGFSLIRSKDTLFSSMTIHMWARQSARMVY